MKEKTILIVGTADTKSEELVFMKQCIQENNGEALVMDVGVLGDPEFDVDYTRHQVAEAANTTNKEIIDLGDENKAMTKTSEGAVNLTLQLFNANKIDGVLMLGGTMGTDLSLDVAEALPFGFPKFIVSTISFSHLIPPERLSADLMMILWSGGLYGLNAICKASLSQACGAVLGAANAVKAPKFDKPVVGMTSLGSSALKYMKLIKPELEKRGYELAIFHTTGQGGRAFENLAKNKQFVCVMDFSLQEVVNEMKGSIVTSGKDRLENAGLQAVPAMIAPGAIDLIDVASWRELPEDLKGRESHSHNRLISSVTMTTEERKKAARLIADKISRYKGKTAFVLPLQGIEEWDRKGNTLHQPEAHKAFCKEMKSCVPDNANFIEVDAHINDQEFSASVLNLFDQWVKEGIVPKGNI
ncbi:MAG: Tm-1-like ATP-binding domain-containing protein [Flavobacteriaceae bacterium]|uniref:Tm-1-like ATP-binding domain-containing protein n=1 Tax=Maribacter dokdonensis TaxID=320912 RepID=UPI0032879CA4